MATLRGDYFDGVTSIRKPVTLRIVDDLALIEGEGVSAQIALDSIIVKPRVGNTPQRLELPHNALLVSTQFDVIEVIFGDTQTSLAHRLETNLKFVLLSLVALIVIVWLGYRYVLPVAANLMAMHLPADLETQMAEQGLKSLDSLIFKPSVLSDERQMNLHQQFSALRLASGPNAASRLEFRDGGIVGPNALAIPGGVIVVTDQLVESMDNDQQIMAVLAHELGHLHHRHGLRMILQNSVTALVAMAVFGDATGVAGVASTMPTVLVHTSFSREFEHEADVYAFALLKKSGSSPRYFAEALNHLVNSRWNAKTKKFGNDESNGDAPRIKLGYLATHPDSSDRIKEAEDAAK